MFSGVLLCSDDSQVLIQIALQEEGEVYRERLQLSLKTFFLTFLQFLQTLPQTLLGTNILEDAP